MEKLHQLVRQLLGMPVLASENGKGVDDLIIYIHLLMIVLFVGWFALMFATRNA